MTTAAMATYAYDQIDQARQNSNAELNPAVEPASALGLGSMRNARKKLATNPRPGADE